MAYRIARKNQFTEQDKERHAARALACVDRVRDDEGATACEVVGYDEQGNCYALVFGHADGADDVCGKVARIGCRSVMHEYDIDWTQPWDENTGEVWDTEITGPDARDVMWMLNEFNAMAAAYDLTLVF